MQKPLTYALLLAATLGLAACGDQADKKAESAAGTAPQPTQMDEAAKKATDAAKDAQKAAEMTEKAAEDVKDAGAAVEEKAAEVQQEAEKVEAEKK